MTAILQLNNIDVRIANKQLLSIDHLALKQNTMTAILGKNGAGKSTLFNAISGEVDCRGERIFHGKDIGQWPRQSLARHLGILLQSSVLSFPFKGLEVVELGTIPLNISRDDGRREALKYMAMTGTEHLAERSYPSLSGGERQRVQLARVLLQLSQAEQPPLLLLDEPTSAQDLGQQHHVLTLCQQLCQQHNITVLAILHDLNLTLRYCHEVCLLDNGTVLNHGEPSAILNPDRVETLWGYRPQALTTQQGEVVLF